MKVFFLDDNPAICADYYAPKDKIEAQTDILNLLCACGFRLGLLVPQCLKGVGYREETDLALRQSLTNSFGKDVPVSTTQAANQYKDFVASALKHKWDGHPLVTEWLLLDSNAVDYLFELYNELGEPLCDSNERYVIEFIENITEEIPTLESMLTPYQNVGSRIRGLKLDFITAYRLSYKVQSNLTDFSVKPDWWDELPESLGTVYGIIPNEKITIAPKKTGIAQKNKAGGSVTLDVDVTLSTEQLAAKKQFLERGVINVSDTEFYFCGFENNIDVLIFRKRENFYIPLVVLDSEDYHTEAEYESNEALVKEACSRVRAVFESKLSSNIPRNSTIKKKLFRYTDEAKAKFIKGASNDLFLDLQDRLNK